MKLFDLYGGGVSVMWSAGYLGVVFYSKAVYFAPIYREKEKASLFWKSLQRSARKKGVGGFLLVA